jgi:hypothetical protein
MEGFFLFIDHFYLSTVFDKAPLRLYPDYLCTARPFVINPADPDSIAGLPASGEIQIIT